MHFESQDIDKEKLQTNREIIQYFLYLKTYGNKKVNLRRYVQVVMKVICEVWQNANIPILGTTTIRKMLVRLLNSYSSLLKKPRKYNNESYWNKLFRISQCKCSIEMGSECICPENKKIPKNLIRFFIDQCGPRHLNLNNINLDNIDNIDNMADQTTFISTLERSPKTVSYAPDEDELNEYEYENISQDDEQLQVSDITLKNYALALDRTDTSDRFGSLLATTLLKDLKISIASKVCKDNEAINQKIFKYLDDLIIDKNKIRRERAKVRAETKAASTNNSVLKCISYDGKKDMTLKKHKSQNQGRSYKTNEEHITIVKEPGSKFVGYTTPESGTGLQIQKAIVNFLVSEGYSMNYLVAINCDGTAVNTGYKTGVNACMEKYLQRPLQWNVCLFHFNELPLKTLLINLIGKQVGPGIWNGEFGTELLSCNQYPVSFSYFLFYFCHKHLFNLILGRKWI